MIRRNTNTIRSFEIIDNISPGKHSSHTFAKIVISMGLTFALTVTIGEKLYPLIVQAPPRQEVLAENTSQVVPTQSTEQFCKQKLKENHLESLNTWNLKYDHHKEIKITVNGTLNEGKFISFYFNHRDLVLRNYSNQDGSDLKVVSLFADKFKVIPFSISGINTSQTKVSFIPDQIGQNARYFLYFSQVLDESLPNVIVTEYNPNSLYSIVLGPEADPFLKISIDRTLILKGYNELKLNVALDYKLKSNVSAINYEIVGTDISSVIMPSDGNYETKVDLSTLQTGEYAITATIYDECYTLKSQSLPFKISYPLFVTWTIDWEGYDVKDKYLDQLIELSRNYNVPITQLFNPRIYVTKNITQKRKSILTNWIKTREQSGDEIGLHLHMWNDLVRSAGVTPKYSPSWANMGTGYDILFSAYSESESIKIINWAKKELATHGIIDLKTFRAGGWAIDSDNLKALEKAGFTVDTSGRTKHKLGINLIPSIWNLKPTTRPFQPSTKDITTTGDPHLNIWEFPNNGADSFQYSYEKMKERFDINYHQMLSKPQVVTYLSHPHWFSVDYQKLNKLFKYIGTKAYDKKNGIVVFTTMKEAYKYWMKNNII